MRALITISYYLPASTWPDNAVNQSWLDLDRDSLQKVVLRLNKILDANMR
jgi:hypothetical protein